MAEFDPVLAELRKVKGGITMLVKQGVDAQTPKELFMGNMFEILNANRLQKEDEKFLDDEGVTKIDDINVRNEKLLGKIDEDIVNLRGLVGQSMEGLKETAKEIVDHSKRAAVALPNFGAKIAGAFSRFITGEKKTSAKEKEAEKDRQIFLAELVENMTGALLSPFKFIKKTYDKLTDGLIGKAGIFTLFFAGLFFLISQYPKLSEAIVNLTDGFVKLFKSGGRLMDPEDDYGIGSFLADNFLLLLGLGLAASAKTIGAFFITAISAAFAKIGTLFTMVLIQYGGAAALKAVALPAAVLGAKIIGLVSAIIGGVMGFFQEYSREYARSGSFLKALGVGMLGLIKGAIAGIVYVLEAILNFVSFGLLDFDLSAIIFEFDIGNAIRSIFESVTDYFENFSITDPSTWFGSDDPENKFMGGSVAAGKPYMVGERGAELFVPGAAGTVIPNGALGGGSQLMVNNSQVYAPQATHSHQHANISIEDSQQPRVGL